MCTFLSCSDSWDCLQLLCKPQRDEWLNPEMPHLWYLPTHIYVHFYIAESINFQPWSESCLDAAGRMAGFQSVYLCQPWTSALQLSFCYSRFSPVVILALVCVFCAVVLICLLHAAWCTVWYMYVSMLERPDFLQEPPVILLVTTILLRWNLWMSLQAVACFFLISVPHHAAPRKWWALQNREKRLINILYLCCSGCLRVGGVESFVCSFKTYFGWVDVCQSEFASSTLLWDHMPCTCWYWCPGSFN